MVVGKRLDTKYTFRVATRTWQREMGQKTRERRHEVHVTARSRTSCQQVRTKTCNEVT